MNFLLQSTIIWNCMTEFFFASSNHHVMFSDLRRVWRVVGFSCIQRRWSLGILTSGPPLCILDTVFDLKSKQSSNHSMLNLMSISFEMLHQCRRASEPLEDKPSSSYNNSRPLWLSELLKCFLQSEARVKKVNHIDSVFMLLWKTFEKMWDEENNSYEWG